MITKSELFAYLTDCLGYDEDQLNELDTNEVKYLIRTNKTKIINYCRYQ